MEGNRGLPEGIPHVRMADGTLREMELHEIMNLSGPDRTSAINAYQAEMLRRQLAAQAEQAARQEPPARRLSERNFDFRQPTRARSSSNYPGDDVDPRIGAVTFGQDRGRGQGDPELKVAAVRAIEAIATSGGQPSQVVYRGPEEGAYQIPRTAYEPQTSATESPLADYVAGEVSTENERGFVSRIVERLGVLVESVKKSRGRQVGAAALAVTLVGTVGAVILNKDEASVSAAEQNSSDSETDPTLALLEAEQAVEFKIGPIVPVPVASVDSTVTASSQWNFIEGAPFKAESAVGVNKGDPALDSTVSPRIVYLVSAPYDEKSKTNAVVETTKESEKLRTITIDMGKLIVEAMVDPESLKDTSEVNLFRLSPEEQVRYMVGMGMKSDEIKDAPNIYKEHRNQLEMQLVGLAIRESLLENKERRNQVVASAKVGILKGLGLSDPSRYAVTFTGDDTFAAIEPVINDFTKKYKIDTKHVQPVTVEGLHMPTITSELVPQKQ